MWYFCNLWILFRMFVEIKRLSGKLIETGCSVKVCVGNSENTKKNLQVEFVEETFILRGNVTTQNNGGFVRLVQDIKLNDDSLSGISFLAKGNDEVYEIHATLNGMKIPPWSYMSRSFQVTDKWKRYEIYFKDLKSSGYSARKMKPKNINNIAFAGYGRDFDVNLMIKDISVF